LLGTFNLKKIGIRADGMTQVVGHLPSKHYALSLQASIKKKKKLTK
jgi:hypothetical protein